MKKYLLLFIIGLIIISCGTYDNILLESRLKRAMLTGRVISEEGLPLEGVTVKLTAFNETRTDINGRFLYNFLPFGKYNMTFEKEGYSKGEYNFVFNFRNRKLPHVKVKMFSMNYLVNEGFEFLKEKKYSKTKDIMAILDDIEEDAEVVLYLKAIYHYTLAEYKDALPILINLKERDRKNIYYQLTLIDLYEKMEMYEEQANLALYVGRNNKDKYYDYIKKASLIYKEKLNNNEMSDKINAEYQQVLKELKKQKDKEK